MSLDLPNYFLADLPDASALTPQLITDACLTLKRNREKFLASQSTESLIKMLVCLAEDWLEPDFPFRRQVLEDGPAQTGFSRETLTEGLDDFFAQITAENLHALILQDLGASRRLDEFVADDAERKQNRLSIANGPELLTHITGGVLPNPTITSILLGVLVRSAQFVKCASGTAFIPRMFAHSLYAAHPKLGACLEIAEWKGGNATLEDALFRESPVVTATGSDETLTQIRKQLPAGTRLVPYGHKLSFCIITREALENAAKTAVAIAKDVSAWNQLGCLSPHTVFVQRGAAIDPTQFSEILAKELEKREATHPRGSVPPEVSAAINTRRMAYKVRASADPSTQIWSSENSTAWTVVHDTTPEFPISCLNRFIHIKPFENIEGICASVEPLRGKISTVGLAASVSRARELAAPLANLGITRICRAGQMQNPPLAWRHDGRPSLGGLVTWTDLEL